MRIITLFIFVGPIISMQGHSLLWTQEKTLSIVKLHPNRFCLGCFSLKSISHGYVQDFLPFILTTRGIFFMI
jgi:hypothetical protein